MPRWGDGVEVVGRREAATAATVAARATVANGDRPASVCDAWASRRCGPGWRPPSTTAAGATFGAGGVDAGATNEEGSRVLGAEMLKRDSEMLEVMIQAWVAYIDLFLFTISLFLRAQNSLLKFHESSISSHSREVSKFSN